MLIVQCASLPEIGESGTGRSTQSTFSSSGRRSSDTPGSVQCLETEQVLQSVVLRELRSTTFAETFARYSQTDVRHHGSVSLVFSRRMEISDRSHSDTNSMCCRVDDKRGWCRRPSVRDSFAMLPNGIPKKVSDHRSNECSDVLMQVIEPWWTVK